MTDETALLAAIDANPDEDTPRLALADLYDERGDLDAACDQRLAAIMRRVRESPDDDGPRLEWADVAERYGRAEPAEFVRRQIEIARLIDEPVDTSLPDWGGRRLFDLETRCRELLDAHWRDWAPPLDGREVCRNLTGDDRPGIEFRRGFVELVTCDVETWFTHGDAIRRQQPVREVTLTGGQVPWGSQATDDGRADYYLEIRRGSLVWRGKPARLPRIGILHSQIIRAVLEAEWEGVTFHLSAPITAYEREQAAESDAIIDRIYRGQGVPAPFLDPAADPAAMLSGPQRRGRNGRRNAIPPTRGGFPRPR